MARTRRTLARLAGVALGLALAACGGSTTDGGTGGASGGTGGTGAGGTGGTGAGGTGGGGSGGAAGTAPAPECSRDEDCRLDDDCCSCTAAPVGSPGRPSCALACEVSQCTALGVSGARCIVGRCTPGVACGMFMAACDSLPPLCEGGMAPSVVGGCWGPCVPAELCAAVDSCQPCSGSLGCVTVSSGVGIEHHCATVPERCGDDRSCACFGASICGGECQGGGDAVECGCTDCP